MLCFCHHVRNISLLCMWPYFQKKVGIVSTNECRHIFSQGRQCQRYMCCIHMENMCSRFRSAKVHIFHCLVACGKGFVNILVCACVWQSFCWCTSVCACCAVQA